MHLKLKPLFVGILLVAILTPVEVTAQYLHAPQKCEFSIAFPEKPLLENTHFTDRKGNRVELSRAVLRKNGSLLQSTCTVNGARNSYSDVSDSSIEALIRKISRREDLRQLRISKLEGIVGRMFQVDYLQPADDGLKPSRALWIYGKRSRLIVEAFALEKIGSRQLVKFFKSVKRVR